MTTFAELARSYATDADSPCRTVEHASRIQYQKLCKRLTADKGDVLVKNTAARDLRRWHQEWTEASGVPMAHALMSMLRMLTGFGTTILEDTDCQRVRGLLGLMRFPNGERRQVFLSYEQASALCDLARAKGWPAIALGQALQFETMCRQKDVIGAWVPLSDRTPSDLIDGSRKWIKGMRWSEIDATLILRHKTSKKKKLMVADLKLAPLVLRELKLAYPRFDATGSRDALPSSGPIILNGDGLPYRENDYRLRWRQLADELGIPKGVQNRDSRSGGITEAFAAACQPDDVRKMATHSQLSTTMGYSRSEEAAAARVAEKRVAARGSR